MHVHLSATTSVSARNQTVRDTRAERMYKQTIPLQAHGLLVHAPLALTATSPTAAILITTGLSAIAIPVKGSSS